MFYNESIQDEEGSQNGLIWAVICFGQSFVKHCFTVLTLKVVHKFNLGITYTLLNRECRFIFMYMCDLLLY